MEDKVIVTALSRLSDIDIEFSKLDLRQIELMAKKYFRNKLKYENKTKKVEVFGETVELGVFNLKQRNILDKAIFKFYEVKSRDIYKHIKQKPKDLIYTLPKHRICINNMVKMIYANPVLKRNRFSLWMRKKFLYPKLTSGELLDNIDTRRDPIEKHLICL
jgi:hypothetical protein